MARCINADLFHTAIHNAGGCDAKDEYSKGWDNAITHVLDILTEQPTVEPQVVRGEWKGFTKSAYLGSDEFGEPKWADRKFYICSKCSKGTVIKSNYCSHCGADMRKESE